MNPWFTIPNFISLLRVLMMFYGFWHFMLTHDKIFFFTLTIIIIALDGLDGVVARKLNQDTALGAKIDIFADRLTEIGYWYFFAFIGYLGYWVCWIFLLRGIVVDFMTRKQEKPLGDSFLRGSRFMRALYGSLKLISFALLILVPNLILGPINITLLFVYLTVIVCILRAAPVLLASFSTTKI